MKPNPATPPAELLRSTGVMRVGVDESPRPPLCFGSPGTPEFRGFEVDLLMAIAARLGLGLHCTSLEWRRALEQLASGGLNMLCRGVTITPERRRLVDFSEPYLETALTLIVRSGSPIQGRGDLIGVCVGVRRATVSEAFVRRNCPTATVRTFDDHLESYRALGTRAVDAVIDHAPIAGWATRAGSGLQVAGKLEGGELRYGMVFAQGNDRLRHDVNQALAACREDGTWERCHRRWLGAEQTA